MVFGRMPVDTGEDDFASLMSVKDDSVMVYVANELSNILALQNDPVGFRVNWDASENLRDYVRGYYIYLGDFVRLTFAERWQWLRCALQAKVFAAIDSLLVDEEDWNEYVKALSLAERFSYLEFAIDAQHEAAVLYFLQDSSVLDAVATWPSDYQLEFVRLICISHSAKAIAMIAPITQMVQKAGLDRERAYDFLLEIILSLLETYPGISDVARDTLHQMDEAVLLDVLERLDDNYRTQKNYLRELLGMPAITAENLATEMADVDCGELLQEEVVSEQEEVMPVIEHPTRRTSAARRQASMHEDAFPGLILAIKQQDVSAIRAILNCNPEFINQTLKTEKQANDKGFTPLFYAAKYATNIEIISQLLQSLTQKEISNQLLSVVKHADNPYLNWNVFMIAFQCGTFPVATTLFECLIPSKQQAWLHRHEQGRLGSFHSLLSSCIPLMTISAEDEKNRSAKIHYLLTQGAVPTAIDRAGLAMSTFSDDTKRRLRYLFHQSQQEVSGTPQLFSHSQASSEVECVAPPVIRIR